LSVCLWVKCTLLTLMLWENRLFVCLAVDPQREREREKRRHNHTGNPSEREETVCRLCHSTVTHFYVYERSSLTVVVCRSTQHI